jgi:REP element-mobilizing transposase RayT
MVAAHHLIWTAYGWWLPNDPRGSMSHDIRVESIAALGEIHHGRKRQQPSRAELLDFFDEARDTLKHPLLTFSQEDVAVIADSFRRIITEKPYTCYACAIMPDHVHALIRRHRDRAEDMIDTLQRASREQLIAAERRAVTHPVWGGPGWKVFLSTQRDIERVVHYIRLNPIKIGLPEQYWDFVKPYDGWLPSRSHAKR